MIQVHKAWAGLALILYAATSVAGQTALGIMPYDEHADAQAEVAAARALARERGQLLMVLFGANWCPDCRAFDAALRDSSVTQLVDDNFVIAKVDVGNWDHNTDVVEAWGDPISGGIPAIVVTTATGDVVYTSKPGDLSRARYMDQVALEVFFARVLALGQATPQSVVAPSQADMESVQ